MRHAHPGFRVGYRTARAEHLVTSPCVTRVFAALTGALLLLAMARAASAQDVMAARDLYASARYDEALNVLNTLRSQPALPASDMRSVEQYRSFCLLALGRSDEAEEAIATIVNTDPLYQPGDDASPRLRAAFQDVRRRVLPEIAARQYTASKVTFDRKDYAEAADLFRQTLALLDDADMQGRLGDLRTLAAGFLDLSVAAAAPPPAPAKPEPAPAPMPAAPRIFGTDDPGVAPPLTVRQELPAFPRQFNLRPSARRGLLELVIGENGLVESAAVRTSVHPTYDALMLNASKTWRYKPAMHDGQPVKFRKVIQVSIDAAVATRF